MLNYREAHALVAALVSDWRARKFPFTKCDVVECPACKGQLTLDQRTVYTRPNTVTARCATPFCVSYTE